MGEDDINVFNASIYSIKDNIDEDVVLRKPIIIKENVI